jgi:hypothetical protein
MQSVKEGNYKYKTVINKKHKNVFSIFLVRLQVYNTPALKLFHQDKTMIEAVF